MVHYINKIINIKYTNLKKKKINKYNYALIISNTIKKTNTES